MDTSGFINSWNPGAEAMSCYTTAEAIGRPGAIIFTKEDRDSGERENEWGTCDAMAVVPTSAGTSGKTARVFS